MKKTTLIAVVVVTMLTSLALAQPGPGAQGQCPFGNVPGSGRQFNGMDRGGMHGMHMQKGEPGIQMILNMSDELALTADQKTKLEKMKSDFAMERIDRQAALEKAQVKLRGLMSDDNASETNVNMAIDEVARLKADLQKMRFNHHKQVQATLTDEQTAKLKDFRMQNRKAMRGQRQFDKARGQFNQQRRGQQGDDNDI
jgi:Spy/CpxP family protein refolding chaperone